MRRMQRDFFATCRDIERWLRVIEARRLVKYALCGLFQKPEPIVFRTMTEIPNLGIMTAGNESLAARFLVAPAELAINVRPVLQTSGGVQYAVDQLHNPESIIFQPGGLYGQAALICGHVGGSTEHKVAKQIFREFDQVMQGSFVKYRGYFVGQEAKRLNLEGVRLITMHTHEDTAYDLDLKQ